MLSKAAFEAPISPYIGIAMIDPWLEIVTTFPRCEPDSRSGIADCTK
jgi:hypothetical protein